MTLRGSTSGRGRSLRIVVPAVIAGLGILSSYVAAGAAETTSTTTQAVSIGSGLAFSGAVITGPHVASRPLNAYQSAVFMQAWIGDAFYGRPNHESLPARVPVYRVDVMGSWGGGTDFSVRAVYYASDGKQAWIAFPSPQITPSTGSPARLDWWVAPPRVIEAFVGTAKLVPTLGTGTSPSTSTVGRDAAKHTTGDVAWPWIVGSVAAVAAVGGLIGWRRRSARRT